MKHLIIFIFTFFCSTYCNSQNRNIVGVFRSIDKISSTYVEFRTDSTVIVKTLLWDSFETKRAFIDSGTWRLVNDTAFLNLATNRDDRPTFAKHTQLVYLIKNKNALYTHRYRNGKFATDKLFKKARKLFRLHERFLGEYSILN